MRAFSLLVLSVVSYVSFAQDFRARCRCLIFPALPDHRVRDTGVDLIADGLSNPWSIAFLPDGDMLAVTERAGRLRLIRDGQLEQIPVEAVPNVKITVLGGLLDVLLHPEFSSNRIVYLSYAKGREKMIFLPRHWPGLGLMPTHWLDLRIFLLPTRGVSRI